MVQGSVDLEMITVSLRILCAMGKKTSESSSFPFSCSDERAELQSEEDRQEIDRLLDNVPRFYVCAVDRKLIVSLRTVSRRTLPSMIRAMTKKLSQSPSMSSHETRLQENVFVGIKRCFSLILSPLQRRVSFLAKSAAPNQSTHAHRPSDGTWRSS